MPPARSPSSPESQTLDPKTYTLLSLNLDSYFTNLMAQIPNPKSKTQNPKP